MSRTGGDVGDVARQKRRLRGELLRRRRAVDPAEREAAGAAVARSLLAMPQIGRARRIALYAALPDELPTRPIFEALERLGRPRLFPRIAGSAGDRLEFAPVDAWDELLPGPLGVLAPPARRAALSLGPEDVALVPGVAFDREGRRLGRGGGHYDRAFAAGGAFLVGIAFELQWVPRVPCDSRDRSMDAIVTERGAWLPPRTPGSDASARRIR